MATPLALSASAAYAITLLKASADKEQSNSPKNISPGRLILDQQNSTKQSKHTIVRKVGK